MDQTDRNALDYESCRRVWRRVSPELDPYPEEKEATDCPAAPAPDLKGLQEMIEGELGDRRAYLEAARRAPNPAARRMMQRMAEREGAHARRLLAVYYLACGQCYRPALASGPGETLPWRQLLRQRYHQEVCAARQYDQAAQSVGDPCLAGLFRELSREEDCHARQLLGPAGAEYSCILRETLLQFRQIIPIQRSMCTHERMHHPGGGAGGAAEV